MDLARQLGVYVRTAPLPTNQSGYIVVNEDGSAIITINQLDHPNRQRFTCAHEIGHYLRRHVTGQTRYVDYRDTLAGLGVDSCGTFGWPTRRAGDALGYDPERIYTYTLWYEPGTSLVAAGYVQDALLPERDGWDCVSRPRPNDPSPRGAKVRWRAA